MIEWFFENGIVIGVVLSIISVALMTYKYATFKYNLPIWKWLKNANFNKGQDMGSGPGGP